MLEPEGNCLHGLDLVLLVLGHYMLINTVQLYRDTDAKASSAMGSSIKSAEVLKFDEMAKDWWDPEGSSAPLHSLNPIRTRFTRDALCLCFG